ncbi:uncharacterized protein LOC132749321 [Ruditapes philippinarum]|uniref:uncharacterized protein LOC132749321 n=1 Tax=Ruditapes philippinarum TaxID=129788 RepID=UPI00295B367A|nr:uncharacterized protein LOC132749321 [Ruditapes philippinarum]XP_060595031.1 uncharacterized protein LOC132749321 [Ruditapes philippinarum]
MQTSTLGIFKGETIWRVGPYDQKTAERLKRNLSLLTCPDNAQGIENDPLPYTIEPILFSKQASSHPELMPESIVRDIFDVKNIHNSGSKFLNHSIEDFILDLVLPIPMAGCLTLLALQNFHREKEMFTVSRNHKEHCIVLTGSCSDGLSLPEVTHIKRKNKVTEGPDEDKIYIFTSLIVDSENRRAFCSLDTSKSPPGYTRLIFNKGWLEKKPSKYPRERIEETFIKRNYPGFLSTDESDVVVRRKLVNILRKYLKDEIRSREKERLFLRRTPFADSTPSVHFSCHGPAVTCELERSDFMKVTISRDNVVALPCPRWPHEASEWIHRDRVWPPKALVRFVVKGGCHIVPKGDKHHKDVHDFLISFSHCEKLIALSLSIKQKRCYMLFKFLFKYSINRINRGLTTYHCKTIFFRLCEKIHEDQWSEIHPFGFLMRLLNQMENCLRIGYLPMYFIPKRNMIHFMTKRTREVVLSDIQKVIENPVGIFLELTEKHRFCWLSQDISAACLFTPLLVNQNLSKSLAQETLLTYISTLLDKGEVSFVLSLLCGTEICDDPPSTETAIYYVEKAAESDGGRRCIRVQALLATLYHQHACSISFGSLNGRKLMVKSLGIFVNILREENCSAWVVGEYYNLLFNLQCYDKIMNHFTTLVRRDCNPTAIDFFKSGIYTVVDYHNRSTAEKAIQVSPEFIVPSILYVSYKAITACICFMGQYKLPKEDIEAIFKFNEKLMKKLQLWLSEKERLYPEYTDEYAHIILGLGYKHLDDIENYKNEFCAAEDFSVPLRKKGNSFVYFEPVTVRIHHSFKSYRYSPYTRKSKRKKSRVPALDFRFRDFLVHEYTHY